MAVTEEEVQAAIESGTALTDDQKAFVMGQPNDDTGNHDDSQAGKDALEAKEEAAAGGPEKTKEPSKEPEKKPAAAEPGAAGKPPESAKTPEADKTGEKPKADAGKVDDKKPETAKGTVAEIIETELKKPDGKEDLTGLDEKHRGLFYELRHQRRRAQDAEATVDSLKFKILKSDLDKKKEDEPKDDELMTVGQTKAKIEEARVEMEIANRNRMTKIWMRETAKEHEDFHQVMELGETFVVKSPELLAKIQEAYKAGDNVAQVTYDLIKADPRYAELAATAGPVKKEDPKPAAPKEPAKAPTQDELDKAAKLKANAEKTAVSGPAGGGDAGAGGDELTIEYVRSLSEAEYAALPTAKRQAILKKFG